MEFEFSYTESVFQLFGVFIFSSLMFFIPGILFTKKAFDIYRAILYGIAIATWVQGSIVVWDMGVFDGTEIQWENFTYQRIIDIFIWATLIIVVVALRKKLISLLATACTFLLILQAGNLIYDYSNGSLDAYAANTTNYPPAGLYQYSTEKNIIHILLDGFQTDVFQEILEEENLKPHFDGFTLYTDNITRYGLTMKSIAAIFSGIEKPTDKSFSEWLKSALTDGGYLAELHNAGFVVNVIPHVPVKSTAHTNYYKIRASYGGSIVEAQRLQTAKLLDFSLFRHSPSYFKKLIYNKQAWLLQGNKTILQHLGYRNQLAFFEDYTEQIEPEIDAPAYHFIHIISPHPPFVANSDCKGEKGLPQNRESYKTQAFCTLQLVIKFLLKLKKENLFKHSLIVLQADHGAHFPVAINENMNFTKPRQLSDARPVTPKAKKIGRAAALLAIKFPERNHPLKISELQTSSLDISRTILVNAGIKSPIGRNDLSVPNINHFGPRRYGRYLINGPLRNQSSWFTQANDHSLIEASAYKFGEIIDFSGLGNAEQYSISGWNWGGINATWTSKTTAILKIPLLKPPNNKLRLVTNLLIAGGKQRVRITVNNTLIFDGELEGSGYNTWQFEIPFGEALKAHELMIKLDLPNVKPAVESGAGLSKGLLGLRIKSMVIEHL
ncbi:MAG: sulfatase-like hydrolase/transferase [Xanthomonadales bacterium]|nr:sulfatase-like hydrolase/transferase [Xanthomonadales bacterium]